MRAELVHARCIQPGDRVVLDYRDVTGRRVQTVGTKTVRGIDWLTISYGSQEHLLVRADSYVWVVLPQ